MDNIKQVGKQLTQIKKDTDAALRRDYPNKPIINRSRDYFDEFTDFEMEFEVETYPGTYRLDLFFVKGYELCAPQSSGGCYVGKCDFYYGSTDTVLNTTYEYVSGTTYVYKNDIIADYTETGANQITLTSARLITDRISVCYVYNIPGCNGCEGTQETIVIDNFNRVGSTWGTATSGDVWLFTSALPTATELTDGDAGRLILSGSPAEGGERLELNASPLPNVPVMEYRWLVSYSGSIGNNFFGIFNEASSEGFGFHIQADGDLEFRNVRVGGSFEVISGNPVYATGAKFWVSQKLEGGYLTIKHWLNGQLEPATWTAFNYTIFNTILFSPNEADLFIPGMQAGDSEMAVYHIEVIAQECIWNGS